MEYSRQISQKIPVTTLVPTVIRDIPKKSAIFVKQSRRWLV